MYRLTCAYTENDDDFIFYECHGHSLHGLKCKGTTMCRDYGSCNCVLTKYTIEEVPDAYAVGHVVYKRTILK